MTIRELLAKAACQLNEAGIEDARSDAQWLLAKVLNVNRMQMLLDAGKELDESQERQYASLLLSRCNHSPLQYLLGEECFYGLPFRVDERVLIPRPETELLCEWALSLMSSSQTMKVLDLCTGSGAIAVAIKHMRPNAEVTASDLSTEALALAEENAQINHTDIRFLQGDLFEPVKKECFHLIVSNPPYIPSADCKTLQAEVQNEPLLALDGGADGLDVYRRICKEASDHLHDGAWLLMEIGQHQENDVCTLLRDAGFASITQKKDMNGIIRMVGGMKENSHV